MGQAMGGYYGAAYGPLGASMAAAAAAAAQQNAINAALTPNPQVRFRKLMFIVLRYLWKCMERLYIGMTARTNSKYILSCYLDVVLGFLYVLVDQQVHLFYFFSINIAIICPVHLRLKLFTFIFIPRH